MAWQDTWLKKRKCNWQGVTAQADAMTLPTKLNKTDSLSVGHAALLSLSLCVASAGAPAATSIPCQSPSSPQSAPPSSCVDPSFFSVSCSRQASSAMAVDRAFSPGYEPSAPPLHSPSSLYSDPEYARYAPPPPSRPSHSGAASRPFPDDSLGSRVMHIASGVFQSAWQHSNTMLRIDLRKGISYRPPTRTRQPRGPPVLPGATVSSGGPLYAGDGNGFGYDAAADDEFLAKDASLFGSIRGGGARVKLMQVWDFPHREEGEEKNPWDVNFGFGANVVMDQGRVEPKFRLRAQHVALHLLPEPALEMRGKWPLGDTNLAVYARYRVPIAGLGRFWESTDARLMINLFHPRGTGVHLTPQGVQFDDHVFQVAKFTTMRVAAAVDFPRQFPLQEGEQPFGLRIARLGLKSKIF